MFSRRGKLTNSVKPPRMILALKGSPINFPRNRGREAARANPTNPQPGKQLRKLPVYPKDYLINDPRSGRWPTSPVNPMNPQTQLRRFMRRQ
jgi:hypothetical protein